MKRGIGCAVVLLIGIVGFGLAGFGFVLLTSSRPSVAPPPTATPTTRPTARPTASPTPTATAAVDPDRYVPRPGELRAFERGDDGRRYRLTYGFVDYAGKQHRLSCTAEKTEHERQRGAFGYDPADIESLENARLQALVEREIERRRLAPHFHFSIKGDSYHWKWKVEGEVTAEERARIQSEAQTLDKWISNDLNRELDKIRDELYRARGFARKKNLISIDYQRVAQQSTALLEDCFQAIASSAQGYGRRQMLGVFLAFFQELTYELPPDRDGRKHTLGFWTPLDVMVRGRGDCDSKSAAFAAMWRHYPGGLLLIVLPTHVLVAVEAPPGPGEHFVRLGNRYYLLCETAGPGKFHPGAKEVSGSYEYVSIDPVKPTTR